MAKVRWSMSDARWDAYIRVQRFTIDEAAIHTMDAAAKATASEHMQAVRHLTSG
ncbi:hypothetical protein FBZ98_101883 [Rhizobium sp. ERR 922]|nr:hypothetical protein FBZ98_101883 [Rhizobium sp. ERR 922]TWC04466.1 hypothetical protein FBZ97_101883 [Rhizobium sp. ERR 942]